LYIPECQGSTFKGGDKQKDRRPSVFNYVFFEKSGGKNSNCFSVFIFVFVVIKITGAMDSSLSAFGREQRCPRRLWQQQHKRDTADFQKTTAPNISPRSPAFSGT
jgi:hypothetical protein